MTHPLKNALPFVRRNIRWIILVCVVLLLGITFELGRLSVYRVHPEIASNEQAQAILDRVGKLIQLPTNEIPTMATIQDATSAKQGQPFLAKAQHGDVLIVYSNAAEAILYRPSTNLLVNVGPVSTNKSTNMAVSTATTPPPVAPANTTNATTTKKKK